MRVDRKKPSSSNAPCAREISVASTRRSVDAPATTRARRRRPRARGETSDDPTSARGGVDGGANVWITKHTRRREGARGAVDAIGVRITRVREPCVGETCVRGVCVVSRES